MLTLNVCLWNNSIVNCLGVRPFACPHCDKKFRTSGHRKTHVASHFKHTELRKMRHQRKPAKVRVGKANVPVPDIPLQEPILITDVGKSPLLGCLARWGSVVVCTDSCTHGAGGVIVNCFALWASMSHREIKILVLSVP